VTQLREYLIGLTYVGLGLVVCAAAFSPLDDTRWIGYLGLALMSIAALGNFVRRER